MATALGVAYHELLLFAAIGFAIGGIDDLLVDGLFIVRKLWRDSTVYVRHPRMTSDRLPPSAAPGRIAVFIPAWQESEVIGAMLAHALHQWRDADCTLFVGVYPNDPATAAAVEGAAAGSDKVVLCITPRPGPTTKADCLNALWRAMRRREALDGTSFKAVLLHDAEHVVAVVNRLATQSRVGQVYGQTHHGYKSRFRNEARLPLCAL
ncbi:hypothetical protein SAMIE_1016470 [Sphingobium amiense]|uniref:Uncharacterized protein n=1 Tax=Sphingobium amiense TaxID=135719 RepID=A0A494W466_9SPHN|nr:glycosyltransferase [Sphingobium amiense]BBD98146.1 hypothetical protein SAMIE_1016470 [Sphingobium amiense]